MNTWQQHQRSKQRARALEEDIRYRQSLRQVCRSERDMERLCGQYETRAVEAERAGQHALAVRLAAQNAKLRKHQAVISGMRGSVEVAHAVQSSNRAMADILKGSMGAAGSLRASASDACASQAQLESMQEDVRTFLEDSEAIYDNLAIGEDASVSEEGERCLRALLSCERREKQRRLLENTDSRLKELQRSRLIENEGGRK